MDFYGLDSLGANEVLLSEDIKPGTRITKQQILGLSARAAFIDGIRDGLGWIIKPHSFDGMPITRSSNEQLAFAHGKEIARKAVSERRVNELLSASDQISSVVITAYGDGWKRFLDGTQMPAVVETGNDEWSSRARVAGFNDAKNLGGTNISGATKVGIVAAVVVLGGLCIYKFRK